MGGGLGEGWTHVCLAESLHCPAASTTTWLIGCIPIQNQKLKNTCCVASPRPISSRWQSPGLRPRSLGAQSAVLPQTAGLPSAPTHRSPVTHGYSSAPVCRDRRSTRTGCSRPVAGISWASTCAARCPSGSGGGAADTGDVWALGEPTLASTPRDSCFTHPHRSPLLTISRPRSTSRGTVVAPARSHSARETEPLPS